MKSDGKGWQRDEWKWPDEERWEVHPINDLRCHILGGDPCPCMPRDYRAYGVFSRVHNSYDGREIGQVDANAIDRLALALTEHGHIWTDDERRDYEHAIDLISMHYEIVQPGGRKV